MKHIYVLVGLLCLSMGVKAQQVKQYTERDYARTPVWQQMINDTLANYFEVEKAYNIYFKHHELPEGEHDVIGEHEEREKNPSKKERKKMQAEDHMRLAVKKYERWHNRMRPYVQEDGRILYPHERLQLFQEQKKLQNKQ